MKLMKTLGCTFCLTVLLTCLGCTSRYQDFTLEYSQFAKGKLHCCVRLEEGTMTSILGPCPRDEYKPASIGWFDVVYDTSTVVSGGTISATMTRHEGDPRELEIDTNFAQSLYRAKRDISDYALSLTAVGIDPEWGHIRTLADGTTLALDVTPSGKDRLVNLTTKSVSIPPVDIDFGSIWNHADHSFITFGERAFHETISGFADTIEIWNYADDEVVTYSLAPPALPN